MHEHTFPNGDKQLERWEQFSRQVCDLEQRIAPADQTPLLTEACGLLHALLDELQRMGATLQEQTTALTATQAQMAQQVAALRQSKERFRMLIQSMPVLVDAFDAAGNIVLWNDECVRVTGYTADEIINNRQALELLYPDPEYRTQLGQSVDWAQQEVRNSEWVITCKDGSRRTIAWSSIPNQLHLPEWGLAAVGVDVTERKQAEAGLRESQALFQAFLDYSPMLVGVRDAEGRHMFSNQRMLECTGLTDVEQALGTNPAAFLPPDVAAQIRLDLMHILTTGEAIERERVIPDMNGAPHVFLGIDFPIYNTDGLIAAIGIIASDITERKQQEERLRLLESAVVNANDAIVITEACPVDEPGPRMLYVNPAFERITGYRAAEVVGKSPRLLQGPQTSRATLDYIRGMLEHWQPSRTELVNYRKDGSTFWVELDIFPVADTSGTYTHWIAIQRDITERRQAETALRQLEQAVEQSSSAIMITDRAGNIEYVNPAFTRFTGYTLQDVYGRPPRMLQTGLTAPEVYQDLWRTIIHGQAWQGEFCNRRKDGTLYWEQASIAPIFDEAGVITHFIGIKEDVTRRKQLENELRHARDELAIRVAERTTQLRTTIQQLQDEAEERQRAEAELRKSQTHLHTIISHLPVVLFALDREGVFTLSEGKALATLGLQPGQQVGLSIFALHRESPHIIAAVQQALAGETVTTLITCSDLMFETLFSPMYAPDGQLIGILGVSIDVTSRMQAEQQLRETQALMQGILDHTPALIFVKDRTGAMLLLNEATATVLQQNATQMLGKPDHTLVPPAIARSWRRQEQQIVTTRQPFTFEEDFPQTDGLHTYLTTKFPLFDTEGNVFAVGGIANDITARKHMEEALRESEERYRTLVETSPNAILLTNLDNVITFCNQRAVQLFGYRSVDELVAKKTSELLAVEPPAAPLARLQQIIAASDTGNSEYCLRRSDGSPFLAEITSAVATSGQGTPTALIIVVSDITERKQSKEALARAYDDLAALNTTLARQRNLLRAILDHLDDGLLLLDNQGIIQEVNQALTTLLGTTPQHMIGQVWHDGLAELALDLPGDALVAAALHERQHQQRRYRRADGSTRVLDLHTIPIHGPDMALEQTILHVIDSTETLRLQTLVLENERFAASGRLVTTVAHEINTPLQALQNALALIEVLPDNQRAQFLGYAQQEIQRIGRIVHQLLDMYRPGAATPGPVQVNSLIERVLLLLGKRIRDQGVRVTIGLMPDLPLLQGRMDELTQVLINLIVNALDAMPDGGELVIGTAVRFEDMARGLGDPLLTHSASIVITITDTGCGIDSALQASIFEAFVSTKEHGTGLGLAISTQIVQQLCGYIDVQSQVDVGSTFTVVLPLHEHWREEAA